MRYRDRRQTLWLLLLGLVLLAFLHWRDRRQELECSRKSGQCLVQERAWTGATWRRELPLASVRSANLYKLQIQPDRSLQGVELWTDSGGVRLAATEPCSSGEVPCPGAQADAVRAVVSFLTDDTQPSVTVEYSNLSHIIRIVTAMLVGFALFSLLGWQHVRVTVSPWARQLVVSKRWAIFFSRHRAFPLDGVEKAAFVETRMGTKYSASVRLMLDDASVVLVRSPSGARAAQRFVDALNLAIEDAQKAGAQRTHERESNRATTIAQPVSVTTPTVIETKYYGWTAAAAAMTIAFIALLMVSYEREEIHCSRRTHECTLETHRAWGVQRTAVPLDAIQSVATYKEDGGKNGVQGVELLTDSGPLALPARLACPDPNLARPCLGQSLDAQRAVLRFLKDPHQQEVDAAYGADNRGQLVLGLFFFPLLLCSLLQWQFFRIEISAAEGWVSIVRRRALFSTRIFMHELKDVQGASFDEKRDEKKARILKRAHVRLTNGEVIWLDRAWSEPSEKERRFVAEVDAGIAAAKRASEGLRAH